MDRKHLGLGLLIGFGLMTYFLLEVHSAHQKQQVLKEAFVGVLNGESIYRHDIEESFANKIEDDKQLEKYFYQFVDQKLISLEASKLNISEREYLEFFDSLAKTPPTKAEMSHFSEWSKEKIQSTRIDRAKEALLRHLRRQNRIEFHSKAMSK